LAPLEREAPELLGPGTSAAVLGAGGAARAVVYALRRRGLKVLVLNRTPARARALARRFGAQWAGLGPRPAALLADRALIVQTTTVGLDGAGDPLPEYAFQAGQVVYDLVYGRGPTPFLARARAAGCRAIGGLAMLQAQAEAQFRLFTGREPPSGGLAGGFFRKLGA
jgi:3-dehydroquinate dehydratase/shikimate dehydrogenase